jgi:hypothetical protein
MRDIKLPCNIGDRVYTIFRDGCPCENCIHGEEANYNSIVCYDNNPDYDCPSPKFSIETNNCEGFEISGDENNNPIISLPGELGCEGLETFCGCDSKVYYSYKDAKTAMEKLIQEAKKNE